MNTPTDSNPQPLAAVLDVPWLTGIDDPMKATHPWDGCCKVCEKPLDGPLWRSIDHPSAKGFFPVNCCDACYERAKQSDESSDVAWSVKCPTEYRQEWNPEFGNAPALAKILKFNPAGGRGLVIHGESGTGKTHMIWILLKDLSRRGIDWLFIESIDLLDNIPSGVFTSPVLVIDDLGNDQLTSSKEVRLLKVLRNRMDWHRPVIVTTQFAGEKLAGRFSDGATAQAVIGRLRRFCDPVNSRFH